MDNFRKFMYTALTAFVLLLVVWISIVYISACGFTLTCHRGQPLAVRTPVPTLAAATLPAVDFSVVSAATPSTTTGESGSGIPRPSNPGGPGEALNLTGDAAAGAEVFQVNCVSCHGPEGTQGVLNPGTDDGAVPTLNPMDPAMVSDDLETFAYNIDLFVQHGSTPAGPLPSIAMPAWGDSGVLSQQQIADVIAYLISLNQ
ncbi:MAG: cytochrome c [Anaerolineales bacterium]|jgi:mono/diheme cytochrome c family protein